MSNRKKTVRRGHVRLHRGKWAVVLSLGVDPATGKRVRRWFPGHPTKQDAEKALTTLLKSQDDGAWVDPSKITVAEFLIDRWVPAISSTVRGSTFDSYKVLVNTHVIPALGRLRLQKLDPGHLNTLYGAMIARKRSASTVRHVHVVMHRALGAAAKWGYVVRNVAALAEPPKIRRAPMRTWSPEELRMFLKFVREEEPRLHAAIHADAMTGVRRGELLGLEWRDLDLDAATLTVARTLIVVRWKLEHSTPKTAKGRRRIDLDAATVAVLRAHRGAVLEERLALGLGAPGGEDLVFPLPDGSPMHPETFSETFVRLVKRSGLPRIRLHDLRHTHATHLLAAGVHPKIVSERLGHASISITLDTYSHVMPGMQAEAAAKVASLVLG